MDLALNCKNPDGRFQLTSIDSYGNASLNEDYLDLLEHDAALAKLAVDDALNTHDEDGQASEASAENETKNITYPYPSQYLIDQLPKAPAYSSKVDTLLATIRAASDVLQEEDWGNRAPRLSTF